SLQDERRAAKGRNVERRSIARRVAGELTSARAEYLRVDRDQYGNENRRWMLAVRMRRARERRMIHEDRAAIIVVDFGTRGAPVRAPVRVLDGGRVVMIVIV